MKKFLPILLVLVTTLIIDMFYIYAYTGTSTISVGKALYAAWGASFPIFSFFAMIALLSRIAKSDIGKKISLALLTLISFAFLLIVFIEIASIKITLVSFYESFWDLANISFFFESARSHPIPSALATLALAALTYFAYIIIKIEQNKKAKLDLFPRLAFVGLLLLLVILHSPFTRFIESYSAYQLTKDERQIKYSRTILAKDKITAEAVEPKNVVHIILESFAGSFTNQQRYPNLTPNLVKLQKEGINLTNFAQLNYAKYSSAGNFISSRGRMHFKNISLQDDISITYLLKKAGYTNVFMRGAHKQAGGAIFNEIYSIEQGFDQYITFNDLKDDKNAQVSGWGVEDSILFENALNKYKELQNKGNPFYLGLFTLDTHVGQSASKECLENPYNGNDSHIKSMISVKCTDTLLTRFINQLKQLPNFKNTLIVIHADHMPYFLEQQPKGTEDKMFGLLLNFGKTFEQNKPVYLFDIPTTIINNVGIKTNAQFLLGEDISNKDFSRTQKTIKPFENKKPDLKLDDYSTEFNIYRSILRFYKSQFIQQHIYEDLLTL